jgi:hypothetical protein
MDSNSVTELEHGIPVPYYGGAPSDLQLHPQTEQFDQTHLRDILLCGTQIIPVCFEVILWPANSFFLSFLLTARSA